MSRPAAPSPTRRPARLIAAAAFAAAAIGAMLWFTSGEPAAPGGPEPGATPAGAAPPAPVPGAGPAPAASTPPPEPDPKPKEWDQVPVAARLSELGPPLARSVYDGLQRARAALEPCFEADAKDAAARPRAPEQEDAWGAAILKLQLEGRPGELVVVNAPLQSLGTSSMLLVDCSERVLRGFRMPAPQAVPGKRYQLQYQLVQ